MRQVAIVREVRDRLMTVDQHYGKIPGCPKDSLWQPGADLLLMAFNCYPEFEIVSATQTDKLVAYIVRCKIIHRPTGGLVGTCIGSCSTRESKYVKAMNSRSRQDNPIEAMDLENTILRMAEKRAKVGATSTMAGASELFTTDLDEATEEKVAKPLPDPTKVQPAPRVRVQQPPATVARPMVKNDLEELNTLIRDATDMGVSIDDVIDPSANLADLHPTDVAKACSKIRIRIGGHQALQDGGR